MINSVFGYARFEMSFRHEATGYNGFSNIKSLNHLFLQIKLYKHFLSLPQKNPTQILIGVSFNFKS